MSFARMSLAVLSLTFIASSAFASQMPHPLLKYTRKSANFGNPRNANTTYCSIYANKVETITLGSLGSAIPMPKSVAYTASVKNAAAVKSLILKAVRGPVTQSRGPTDGPVRTYEAFQTLGAGAPMPVLLQLNSGINKKNTSAAAKKLVEFIDFNCNQQ